MRPIIVSAFLVLALAGCSKRQVGEVSSLPDGWLLAQNKKEGISMEMPSSWQSIDFSDAASKEQVDELLKANPEMAANKAEFDSLVQSGAMKLYLKGRDGAVQVLVIPAVSGVDRKVVADTVEASAKQSLPPGSRTVRSTFQLGLGPAEKLKFDVPMRLPTGGTMSMTNTTYLTTLGENIVIASSMALLDDDAGLTGTFERMVKSLKIAPKPAR